MDQQKESRLLLIFGSILSVDTIEKEKMANETNPLKLKSIGWYNIVINRIMFHQTDFKIIFVDAHEWVKFGWIHPVATKKQKSFGVNTFLILILSDATSYLIF